MSDELQIHLRDNIRMLGSILGDTIKNKGDAFIFHSASA